MCLLVTTLCGIRTRYFLYVIDHFGRFLAAKSLLLRPAAVA